MLLRRAVAKGKPIAAPGGYVTAEPASGVANERVRSPRFRCPRNGRFLRRQGHGPQGHHRDSFHGARTGLRRHAHVSVRERRCGADRCAQAFARHELQERDRRSAARRRQGGHHRRSRERQDRREAARLRRRRQHALRALHHGDGCRHRAAGHARHCARHEVHRRLRPAGQDGRRFRTADGARRFRRSEGRGETPLGRRHHGGSDGRDPGPGQGRHGCRQAPARRRRETHRRRCRSASDAARRGNIRCAKSCCRTKSSP